MKIEYKTEAKVLIPVSGPGCRGSIAAVWNVGDDALKLNQGGSAQLVLSKSQLLKLAELAPSIARDLGPQALPAEGVGL